MESHTGTSIGRDATPETEALGAMHSAIQTYRIDFYECAVPVASFRTLVNVKVRVPC